MAHFVVDPDGTVKDCRTRSERSAWPPRYESLSGVPRSGSTPPKSPLQEVRDYVVLYAVVVVIGVIGAIGKEPGMVTGTMPSGHGPRPFARTEILSVPPPPVPHPLPWPPVSDPPQATRPLPPAGVRELLELPSHLDAAVRRRVDGRARLPAERGSRPDGQPVATSPDLDKGGS